MSAGSTIGAGSAPRGWPAYSKAGAGVRCNYLGCGHRGSLDRPAKMECAGRYCACSCCRLLAGERVHGVSIAPRSA